MELVGKVFLKSPIEEGVSKAGRAWKKRFYIVETQDQYPRKVAFTVFGEDRVNEMENRISEGMMVRVSFDLESREYNGRWYTDASAWRIEAADAAPAAPAPMAPAAPAAAPQSTAGAFPPPPIANDANDDLPF